MKRKNVNRIEVIRDVSCLGKFQFKSARDAKKHAKRRKFLEVYKCIFCGFWHVGHAPKNNVRTKYKDNKKKLKKLRRYLK